MLTQLREPTEGSNFGNTIGEEKFAVGGNVNVYTVESGCTPPVHKHWPYIWPGTYTPATMRNIVRVVYNCFFIGTELMNESD